MNSSNHAQWVRTIVALAILFVLSSIVVWFIYYYPFKWLSHSLQQLDNNVSMILLAGMIGLLLAARVVANGVSRSHKFVVEFRARCHREAAYSQLTQLWIAFFRNPGNRSLNTTLDLDDLEVRLLMRANPQVLKSYSSFRKAMRSGNGDGMGVLAQFSSTIVEMRRDIGITVNNNDQELIAELIFGLDTEKPSPEQSPT